MWSYLWVSKNGKWPLSWCCLLLPVPLNISHSRRSCPSSLAKWLISNQTLFGQEFLPWHKTRSGPPFIGFRSTLDLFSLYISFCNYMFIGVIVVFSLLYQMSHGRKNPVSFTITYPEHSTAAGVWYFLNLIFKKAM